MKKIILPSIIFLIVFAIMSYPLVFGISKFIAGFFSTDEPYGFIWFLWLVKYLKAKTFLLPHTDYIAYPFGINLAGGLPVSYIFVFINYVYIHFLNQILTYNLQIMINFLFAFLFLYILALFLSKSHFAALFSGFIFGYSPYLFIRSWQHLGETYLWMLPMVLLGLFILEQKPQFRFKLFCILGLVLTTVNFGAVIYLSVILAVYFINLVISLKHNKNNKYQFFNFLIITISALIVVIPQFFLVIFRTVKAGSSTASAWNPYHRPFEDLFAQSAKPLSYFLPPVAHPIFGKFTEGFLGSPLYGYSLTEHTLYLGWTPLILAFVAFRRWRRMKKIGTAPPCGDSPCDKENYYIGFFVFLAIVAWFFSQPPWWQIGPLRIYMPSFFMYKLLPMFRAYCRFGIVVMLAVAVLAGFGLKFILEKFKSQKTKIAVTGLFCCLVLFEFWNWPPYKVIDVAHFPSVYYWLKEQPKDIIIAEYPLDADSPNELYKFYQTKHEKRMIDSTIPGTEANRVAKTLVKLSEKTTTAKLREWGVRYAVVHRDSYLETELIEEKEELDKIPHNPGLKLVRSFSAQECPRKDIMCVQKSGPIDVYEVVAQPIVPGIKEK